VSNVVCAADSSGNLSGRYFDLHDATGPVRIWMKDPVIMAKGMVVFPGDGTTTVNVTNGTVVTIGSKEYTFKTTPSVEGDVRLNSTYKLLALNLIRAINHTGTPGTDYVCAAAHPQVTADASPSESSYIYSSFKITATVSTPLSLSSSDPSKVTFGNQATGVLTRVINPTDNTLLNLGVGYTFKDTVTSSGDIKIGATKEITTQNLIKAINLSGLGDNSDYHSGQVPNLQFSCAEAFVGNTLALFAKEGGTAGNVAYTPNMVGGEITFGASYLAGGIQPITVLYGGYSVVPPALPTLGRLLEVPFNRDSSASVVAAAINTVVDQDPEFVSTVSTATVTVNNLTPGVLANISSGTFSGVSGWTFTAAGTAPADIYVKSIGTSEIVVVVTPS
jgi:hypothetical protein